MQQNKLRIQQLKASVKDYVYIAISALIVMGIMSNFDIKISPKGSEVFAKEPTPIIEEVIKDIVIKEPDSRISKLNTFLLSKDSPLAAHTELIISQADKYGLDWTRLVAIAGIESQYGIKLPTGSHNAWGIGGSKFMHFKTWEDGIRYASKLLGTRYKQNENQGIKNKYCPESDGCNPAWAAIVTKASNEILALEGKK